MCRPDDGVPSGRRSRPGKTGEQRRTAGELVHVLKWKGPHQPSRTKVEEAGITRGNGGPASALMLQVMHHRQPHNCGVGALPQLLGRVPGKWPVGDRMAPASPGGMEARAEPTIF